MTKLNSGIARVAAFAAVLLALGATAKAQSLDPESALKFPHQRSCSERTIAGDYGWSAEGVLIGTPGLPSNAPFRSIGTAHLDGKGNLTWLERTVINGKVVNTDFTEATGTYNVNRNCTGSVIVYTPFSPVPLNLALVVVHQGQEFRTVLTTDAVTTVFKRLE